MGLLKKQIKWSNKDEITLRYYKMDDSSKTQKHLPKKFIVTSTIGV
jgi:hypothetical protein